METQWYSYTVGEKGGFIRARSDADAIHRLLVYYSVKLWNDVSVEPINEDEYGGRAALDAEGGEFGHIQD